jgi:ABC-type sugar transport system ATPase subunit
MAQLQLNGLTKRFDQTVVLDGLDLTVEAGEFIVLVGPSGCGKSTVLRLISGLDDPTQGDIWLDGRRVNAVAPKDRDIAMVFQNYALYPHMSVADNLAFGLKMRKLPKAEIQTKVANIARMLQLEPLLKRKPKQLSGGQRQRVALGRAMVRNPKLYLMDEPLSNLDAQLRSHTRGEIMQLHAQLNTTTLYVTHDQTEAMTMGHRMVVLNQGKIQQVGKPLDVYQQPVNHFVAGFLGQIRFVPVTRLNATDWQMGAYTITQPGLPDAITTAIVGMRPEFFTLETHGTTVLHVKPTRAEQLGREKLVFFPLHGGHTDTAHELIAQVPPDWAGDALGLAQTLWFDTHTLQRLIPYAS